MRFRFTKVSAIVLVGFIIVFTPKLNAQEFRYQVQQDRLIGDRAGELIISDKGVEYRAEKKEKENQAWTYNDIRLFEILSPTKIRIWTYRDRKLLLGKDESVTFKIVEGEVDPKLSDFLRVQIRRPFVTSFVKSEQTLLAQIPVKHSHRIGGCEGVLKVFADHLVYESQTGHDSRSWRWTDIRSVGRPDIYHFDVETFEPQTGASGRTFNFVLKEQMDDGTYDLIWSRVYRPTPLIRVSESRATR